MVFLLLLLAMVAFVIFWKAFLAAIGVVIVFGTIGAIQQRKKDKEKEIWNDPDLW